MFNNESPSGIDLPGLQAFLHESGLDEEDLQDLFELFFEDAPDHLQKLREAVATGDCTSVATAAHAFKSPAALICASKLAAQLAHMEEQGRQGETTALEDVDAVAAELDVITRNHGTNE